MVVSPFDRLRSARSQIVEKCRYCTAKPIIAQNTNLVAEKMAVPRTRGSVRRASGFVQIAITLTTDQNKTPQTLSSHGALVLNSPPPKTAHNQANGLCCVTGMAPTGHSALGSTYPTLTHGLPLLVHRSAQECRQQASENPILCRSRISRRRASSTVTFAPCHHFPFCIRNH